MCGVRLQPAAAAAADAAPETTYLAERIRNNAAPPDAERKQVTVLFADLVGSTALISNLDPERAAATMDPSLQVMVRAVRQHGGLVVRIQGDGIMALFSVPVAQEDHAARGCRAALAIRDELARAHVPARVGVNSGEVVLRATRGDLVVDYDAVGVTVHLAARIEHHARPGSACIGETTARAVAGLFHLRSLGPVALKGLRTRTDVFELVGSADGGSRWQTRVLRGLTAFVGRTRELAALARAAEQTAAGNGRVVLVSGAAGSGKSRLIHEAASQPIFADWLVLEAAGRSEEMRTSYRPLAGMLRTWLGVATSEAPDRVAAALRDKVTHIRQDLEPIVAPLLNVIGLPVTDPAWLELDPPARRRAIMTAFATLLRHCAARQPVLLLVEDAHWCDQETISVLNDVAEHLPGTRLLLLATSRAARNETNWRPPHASRINLAALDHKNARRLGETLLGSGPDLASLIDHIVLRAEGIPLFIEEMIRSLVDTGELAGQRGSYRLTGPLDRVRIPASIQTVLAARIDRLSPALKRLLQVVAAIGQSAPVRLLAATLAVPEARIAPDLEALQGTGLTVISDDANERSIAFRHALIQEVTYGSMLVPRRQALHAAIADAMELVFAGNLEEHIEALGRHTLAAGLWQRAAGYLQRAAQRALSRSAHSQAIGFVEDALQALHHLPTQSRDTIAQEIELRLMLRVGHGALGRYRDWLGNLDEAERLARNIDDVGKQLAIRVSRLHLLNGLGTAEHAVTAGDAAVQMARMHGDTDHLVSASFFFGQALAWHGEFRRAIAVTRDALASLADKDADYRGTTTGTPSVLLQSRLAFDYAMVGAFDEACRYGRQACDTAAALRRGYDQAYAAYGYGSVFLYREDSAKAVEVLEAGLETAESNHLSMLCAMLDGVLGCAYLLGGQNKKALHHTERAVQRSEALAYLPVWPLFFRALVESETRPDRDAAATCRTALKRAQQKQHTALLAWTRWLSGRIALRDDATVATRRLAAAARMAHEMDMLPLLARCRFDLAAAADSIGNHARSAEAIKQAEAIWSAIGMRPRMAKVSTSLVGV